MGQCQPFSIAHPKPPVRFPSDQAIRLRIANGKIRPVADVLKVRLHAARTKVGNFLRHQDSAGALNFWKSLEVCRTVRVGFHRT